MAQLTLSRDRMRLAVLAGSACWLCMASLWIWHYTVDDAFIGFRYAENLANGYGLVLNKGERVEGYSNFLWIVLLAGASKIAANPILVSKLIGLMSSVLTLLACDHLCRILTTEEAPVYGISVALVASNGLFLNASVEGLETPLFTMLLCWGVLAYLNGLRADRAPSQVGWLAGSSLLFTLLVMTRPDGALTYGLLWLHAARKFRARSRNLAVFTLPLIVLYAPYFAWRWHYYGFFFPNTFYAKRGGTLALYARGASQIFDFLSLHTGGFLVAGLVALSALLFSAVETTVIGLVALSRLIFELWSGGMTAGKFRFLVPALPLIWILAERVLVGWIRTARLGPRYGFLLVALSGLLIAAQVADYVRLRHYSIERERAGMEQAHISLGKWLKVNSPPNAKIAVGDIGAIGYWSGLRVLDLDGLADTHIAHLPGTFGGKGDSNYVLSESPDFIVLRASRCKPELDEIHLAMDKEIYANPVFQHHFHRLSCWDFWADYYLLLYKRNAHFTEPARTD